MAARIHHIEVLAVLPPVRVLHGERDEGRWGWERRCAEKKCASQRASAGAGRGAPRHAQARDNAGGMGASSSGLEARVCWVEVSSSLSRALTGKNGG